MNILDMELFLGLSVSPELAQALDQVNPHLRQLFIQDDPSYLQSVETAEGSWLGKRLGSFFDYSQIELMEANIFSLLKRLNEELPVNKEQLQLITIPKN